MLLISLYGLFQFVSKHLEWINTVEYRHTQNLDEEKCFSSPEYFQSTYFRNHQTAVVQKSIMSSIRVKSYLYNPVIQAIQIDAYLWQPYYYVVLYLFIESNKRKVNALDSYLWSALIACSLQNGHCGYG